MITPEDQKEVKKRFRQYKIVSVFLAITPIVLILVAYFLSMDASFTGLMKESDPQFLFIVRVVFVSVGLLHSLVAYLLNKYLFNFDKILEKLSSIENIKKRVRESVNHPLLPPEQRTALQEWIKNPQEQELLRKIRRNLFLESFVKSKIIVAALGSNPSTMGFVLYALFADKDVFALLLGLSYVMFYLAYTSEEKLAEALRRLLMQPMKS